MSATPQIVEVVLPASVTVTAASWGSITGTLSDQTDLQTVLDEKLDSNGILSDVDLVGGTVLTISQSYHDTFNSNRALTFVGSPVNGDIETRLRMYVTSPMTLIFPTSYRVGQLTNPITTLDFPTGYHEMSWSYSGGIFWLLDDIGDAGDGTASWGGITGVLSDQTDLQVALDAKQNTINDVLILTPRASNPSSPIEGQVYSNSTDHHLYFYDGTTWKTLDN